LAQFACLVVLLALFVGAAAPSLTVDKSTPYAASIGNREAAAKAFEEIGVLLAEASRLSGLPIREKVKSAIASRNDVQRYLKKRMTATANPKRMHGEELALKKFGLIPADCSLEAATMQLLAEQAAAYYDPRSKEIFIADWTPIAVQRPAIIHELTHALQDQQVDLDKFLDDRLGEDEQMARAAVIEGQATAVMMQYMLAQNGVDFDTFPGLDQIVSEAQLAEVNEFPLFTAAPAYLRESLLFPYTTGMRYARSMKLKLGNEWFASVVKDPPRTTAQILHPDAPAPAGLDQLKFPDIGRTPAGFARVGDGMMGELDVQILLKLYCGAEAAERLAPGWRGLRYAVYENAKENRSFLVHNSRWQDAKTAADFAEAYKTVLAAKGVRNARTEVNGDTVTIFEGMPDRKQQ
jgi:hypothetical protein